MYKIILFFILMYFSIFVVDLNSFSIEIDTFSNLLFNAEKELVGNSKNSTKLSFSNLLFNAEKELVGNSKNATKLSFSNSLFNAEKELVGNTKNPTQISFSNSLFNAEKELFGNPKNPTQIAFSNSLFNAEKELIANSSFYDNNELSISINIKDNLDTNIELNYISGTAFGAETGDTVFVFVNSIQNSITNIQSDSSWVGTILLTGIGDSITALLVNEHGDTAMQNITVNLDNVPPFIDFTPIMRFGETESIQLNISVQDTYSYIHNIKLYYISMDSYPSIVPELVDTITVNDSKFTGILTIPERQQNEYSLGYVYYYIETSDTLGNTSFFTANGQESIRPSQISDFIKIIRQNFTTLKIDTPIYADTDLMIFNSKNLTFTGQIGHSNFDNFLTVYDKNNNIIIDSKVVSGDTFSVDLIFDEDGSETITFKAETVDNFPLPTYKTISFNIKTIPPDFNLFTPVDGQYVNTDTIYVKGHLYQDNEFHEHTLKIIVNNDTNNIYLANWVDDDSTVFECQITIDTSIETNYLSIIASDYIDNKNIKNIVVNYRQEGVMFKIIDLSQNELFIKQDYVISNFVLGDMVKGISHDSFLVKMELKNDTHCYVKFSLDFTDTNQPLQGTIKTIDDPYIYEKINDTPEPFYFFFDDDDYQNSLPTLREIVFLKDGIKLQENQITNFTITYKLPEYFRYEDMNIYRFHDEIIPPRWIQIPEDSVSRSVPFSDTISANLTSLGTYIAAPRKTTYLQINKLNFVDETVYPYSLNTRNVFISGKIGMPYDTNSIKIFDDKTDELLFEKHNIKENTNFSVRLHFESDGENILRLEASTEGGLVNTNYDTLSFYIDITPPEIKIIDPFDGKFISDTVFLLKGRVDHHRGSDTIVISVIDYEKFYDVFFDENDFNIFYCTVVIPPLSEIQLEIIATDFIGNIQSKKIRLNYRKDYELFNIIIQEPSQVIIDENFHTANLTFWSDVHNRVPDTATIIMRTHNGNINLFLDFKENNILKPVSLVINTADKESLKNIISSGKNSVSKFGSDAHYNLGLSTVREFVFSEQSFENFNEIEITYDLTSSLNGYDATLYKYNKFLNLWEEINENQITKKSPEIISANLLSFSIYGVFLNRVPFAEDLNNLVIFPSPFRPNDNIAKTGVEYSPNNDMSGIRIKGIPENSKAEIFTIRGERIAQLKPDILDGGLIIWDAKYNGKGVASGVYVLVVTTPNQTKVKKFAVVR